MAEEERTMKEYTVLLLCPDYVADEFGKETYLNTFDVGADLHTVKAGVNYHFGGPVVAKY